MRAIGVAAGVFTVVALAWAGVSGQQEMRERPGLGSGIVDVRGTVSVSALPAVTVATLPAVTVSRLPDVTVSTLPAIRMAPHEFLSARTTYVVVWSDGQREEVTAIELGRGGWIRVAPRRWINLDTARAVEAR